MKLLGVSIDTIDHNKNRYYVTFMRGTKWGYSPSKDTQYILNRLQVDRLTNRLTSLGYVAHKPIPPKVAWSWVFDTKIVFNDNPEDRKVK